MENPSPETLQNTTSPHLKTSLSFHEELIQFLAGSMPLEKKLLSAFPGKEFPLKILRGLPRLYDKDDPRKVRFKEGFSNLSSLKKMAMKKFLLPLYETIAVPKLTKVTLLNYVFPDGGSDFIAAKEVAIYLKQNFPHLHVEWVAIVPRSLKIPYDASATYFLEYDKEYPAVLIPEDAIASLGASHLILELSAVYPGEEELKKLIREKNGAKKLPQFLRIGRYGFVESKDFNPESGNASMGLHFLEHGIFFPTPPSRPSFQDISHDLLRKMLLGNEAKYPASRKFYLAHLLNPTAGAIYLHALLQKEAASHFDIDICTPHIQWLIAFIAEQNRQGNPLLEGAFGIRQIEIHDRKEVYTHQLQSSGKTVRILCPGFIGEEDLAKLMALSENFVGVQDDSSFSLPIANNKVFFYDGAPHSSPFLRDLVALAENGISQYKGSLRLFRNMRQQLLQNKTQKQWVNELYFQESRPWQTAAKEIGAALQDPSTEQGFQALSAIIRKDYSFYPILPRMIQRAIAHFGMDKLEEFEEKCLHAFGEGQISAHECWILVKDRLSKKS